MIFPAQAATSSVLHECTSSATEPLNVVSSVAEPNRAAKGSERARKRGLKERTAHTTLPEVMTQPAQFGDSNRQFNATDNGRNEWK